MTVFNVQILNSAAYMTVTGEHPPAKPMTAVEYAQHGFPFFKMYEEPSSIYGDFGVVKSVAEIDKKKEVAVNPSIVNIAGRADLTNPCGPLRPFRTVKNLKDEYSSYHVVHF